MQHSSLFPKWDLIRTFISTVGVFSCMTWFRQITGKELRECSVIAVFSPYPT